MMSALTSTTLSDDHKRSNSATAAMCCRAVSRLARVAAASVARASTAVSRTVTSASALSQACRARFEPASSMSSLISVEVST